MKKDLETIFSDGLQFFGNNNRLISHELKNVLAIISETLGLIEELIELNETGMKLDPGKLKSLSNSIIEEVSRANSIIRNMNAFAHSVDEFIGEVDLNQSIDLIIRLSQLDSSRKNTEILFNTNEKRILYTSPFFLGALISHAIDFAVLCAGSNRKIEISTSQDMHGLRIVFSGLEDIKGTFPSDGVSVLANVLSAQVAIDSSQGEISIFLPQEIGDSLIKNLAS